MRTATCIGGVALAALVALGACGGSASSAASSVSGSAVTPAGSVAPTSPREIALYKGSDRQQMLEDGARKEGKLTWYTTIAGPVIDRLIAGFKQKYPYIDTTFYRADDMVSKAAQEAQAGQNVFDVVEASSSDVRIMVDSKLVARFSSPALAGMPDSYKYGADGTSVESAIDRNQFVSFGYNTKLIPDSAVPQSPEDLLKPAFQGKLGIAGSSTGPRWIGLILHTMGNDKGRQFLTQLATQQKPRIYQLSSTALTDLVAKGEVPATPTSYESDALRVASEQGSPVKWLPLQPVMASPGFTAPAAKAPHPHAAMLFIDYLLGDGEKVFSDLNMHPASDKAVASLKFWVPEQGRTVAQIQDDLKQWTALLNSTFH